MTSPLQGVTPFVFDSSLNLSLWAWTHCDSDLLFSSLTTKWLIGRGYFANVSSRELEACARKVIGWRSENLGNGRQGCLEILIGSFKGRAPNAMRCRVNCMNWTQSDLYSPFLNLGPIRLQDQRTGGQSSESRLQPWGKKGAPGFSVPNLLIFIASSLGKI